MESRTFRKQAPHKVHLVRGRGLNGEITDLRKDVDTALNELEAETIIDIQWQFNGALTRPTGTNPGQYGICHTGGGDYPTGSIWYDVPNGPVINVTKKGLLVSPRMAVAGAVSMDADGIYYAASADAPYSWTAKGGSGGGGGLVLVLSTAERLALSATDGQVVYDTDLKRLYVWQFDIDWPVWSEV